MRKWLDCCGLGPIPSLIIVYLQTRSLLEATSLQLGAHNTALQDDSGPPWKQPAAMVNSFEDTALYASQKPLVHSQKKHKITSTIQKSRHVALDNECRSRNGSVAWRSLSEAARRTVAQRIVVNDEHELLYCGVPLLSTGPWMKVMYFISPNAKSVSDIGHIPGEELGKRNNFAYLSSFSLDEQERRLNTYLSFMVSRHPFQRLAIAYKVKLQSDNAFFHDRYGKTIVKNYQKGSKNPSGDDVKFSEFAQYVSEVNFAYLSSFSLDEQERRLNTTYLSFMVSRHPFQRLAIAYKVKLQSDNAFFHDRYGKTIVKNY